MEVRGRSRKNKGRAVIRRRIRAWMSTVLAAAMIMGNMAASVNTVLASPSVAREEFRIRAAAIQKAAEKALDEGEGITEEILIDGKDKSALKEYQEFFKADGRLYELDLLKDIETVKDVDGVTLRVFMRLPEDADPATHVLNGEEEIYFLYVNDGDESVTARLNIEGLISGFSTVRPYEAVFGEREKLPENQDNTDETMADEEESAETSEGVEETTETKEAESAKPAGGGSSSGGSGGNGSSGNGGGTGNSSSETDAADSKEEVKENNTDSIETDEKESNAADAETDTDTETDTKADDAEQAEDKTENGNKADTDRNENKDSASGTDTGKEDKADASDKKDKTDKPDSSENSSSSENAKPDSGAGKDDSKDSGSENSDNKNSGNENTDSSSSSSKDSSDSSSSKDSSDSSSSKDSSDSSSSKDSSDSSSSKGGSDSGSSKDSGSSSDDSGNSDNHDSAGESALNRLGISLNQILRVAEPDFTAEEEGEVETAQEEAEIEETEMEEPEPEEIEEAEAEPETTEEAEGEPEETEEEPETENETVAEAVENEPKAEIVETEPNAETAGSRPEEETAKAAEDEVFDSDYDEEDTELADEEDAETAIAEEKDPFEKKGVLEGKIYNLVAFESGLTARVFTTTLEKLGMNKEDLTEGGHILTYMVAPVGSAVVINAPELVRDESEVTFGVIPQIGYRIAAVTANGEELERVNAENLASNSNAKKALASASDGTKKGVEYDEEAVAYFTIPRILDSQEIEILMREEVEGSHPEFRESMTMSDGVTVSVSAEEGILPEGTYLSVEEVTDKVADAVKENIEAERNTAVNTVIAYDINLMLDGKKLSNNYWKNDYVTVEFSGEKIKEMNKASSNVEIAPLETPTETVEAALGETEEEAVLEEISSENIRVKTEEAVKVEAEGEDTVSFRAEHFTVYVIMGNTTDKMITIEADALLYGTEANPNVADYPYELNGITYHLNGIATQIIFKNSETNGDEVNISDVTLKFEDGTNYEGNIVDVYHIGFEKVEKFIVDNGGITAVFRNGMNLNYEMSMGEFRWIVDQKVSNQYDLYFYALLPDVQLDQVDNDPNPNNNWYGIGLGYISGVKNPNDQRNSLNDEYVTVVKDENGNEKRILIDGDDIQIVKPENRENQLKKPYPDITVDGKSYQYDKLGTGADNTYSIKWIRTVLSNGINVGHDKYFEEITNQYIYHRDGQLQLNDGFHYTVTFNILQPEETEFEIQEDYTRRVEAGFHEQNLSKPTTPDKIANGMTYIFDGWYLDENCTQKATFTGTITQNTDYYGRYIPQNQLIYNPNADDATGVMNPTPAAKENGEYIAKVAENQFIRTGYEFVGWNTKPDGTGMDYETNGIYKFEGNEEPHILYAQWKSVNQPIVLNIKKIFKDGAGKQFDEKDVSFEQIKFKLVPVDKNGTSDGSRELQELIIKDVKKDTKNPQNMIGVISFENVSEGYYYIQEIAPPTGYQKMEDKMLYLGSQKDDSGEEKFGCYSYDMITKKYTFINSLGKDDYVEVTNNPIAGVILPDTGGPGLAMFERFGWFLLMIALLMAGMEVRCYGERKSRRAAVMQNEEYEEPL